MDHRYFPLSLMNHSQFKEILEKSRFRTTWHLNFKIFLANTPVIIFYFAFRSFFQAYAFFSMSIENQHTSSQSQYSTFVTIVLTGYYILDITCKYASKISYIQSCHQLMFFPSLWNKEFNHLMGYIMIGITWSTAAIPASCELTHPLLL